MNYNHHLALLFLTRAEGSQKTSVVDLHNYTCTLCKPPPQLFTAGFTDKGT